MTETRTDSATLFAQAQRYIPGGVNSPVRAFGAVGGEPVFISRAAGANHGQMMQGEDFRTIVEPLGRRLEQRTTLYGRTAPA